MKLHLIALLLIILTLPQVIYAQTVLQRMTVTPMEAPRTVAVFPDHPDKAGLIFESTLTNLRFDSQMDGIVQIRDESATGRYILIIEPFTQVITITAPGFIQERLRIGTPQAREVRYFRIAPEERRQDVISVIFNVTPTDAQLFVDEQQIDINQTVQIEPGQRSVRIEREGFRTVQDIIAVSPANIAFTFALDEIDIVPVQIRSTTVGATVTIDGVVRGEIDRSGVRALFLYPGTYTLQLSQSGFISRSIPIEVTEDGNNQFSIDLTSSVGELALQVTPADARVLVNREDYSGRSLIELAPGRYRLEVEKEHFEPFSETIDIQLNQRVSRSVTLEAHTGTLQFMVTPNDARVELVDGAGRVVNQWTGIQILRDIQAGPYTLRVSSVGHVSKEEPIMIRRAQTTQVSVDLEAISVATERVAQQETNVTQPSVQVGTWPRDTQTEVVPVTSPATGRVWMDRNLGASRAATARNDTQAYGDYYQWGRARDGHQSLTSRHRSTLSTIDAPGHGEFILSNRDANWDWRSPQNSNLWQGVNGINNPCPEGYRLPTEAEWNAERSSWSRNNRRGALDSALKLPSAGFRSGSSSALNDLGSHGYYWSSSRSDSSARTLHFSSSNAAMDGYGRAAGFSVRCIRD